MCKGKKMNLQKSIDVVGVGNAIVDIIARSDDKFIKITVSERR